MADILRFLDSDRAVEAMNRHIWRNEGYRESLKKDALFRRMSGGKE
jgi:hypothetical protein